MPVRVRMFAALREAAGDAETTAAPGRLPVILDALRERYGPMFAERLGLCTVLVDGDAVSRDADVAVPDGAEVALLPPVSGGSAEARPRTSVALRVVLGAVVATAGVVADLRGDDVFWLFVVGVATLVLVDLARLLTLAGSPPVLPAALVGGVGLPIVAGLRPAAGWDAVGAFTAGAFLLACLLVLLFGRRRRVVEGLSSTVLIGLMVGLGATSLIVLRSLPDGHRWVLGLGLVVVAADCGPPLLTMA
ncbi:MAG: MoaD/ThiS family protein, partial [Actinomycetota bacterium]|nr:MoaD/ThiS family protein [Actinomycetota bacterium]